MCGGRPRARFGGSTCIPTVDYAEGQTQAEATARVRVLGGWSLLYGSTTLITSVGLEALETNFGALATWRPCAAFADCQDSE